ncbi:MAG TPA: hypothetical protein VN634_07225 [Candidatus Limnocylindrales bacterium]|nr:hypothetical protein [Candidatus Limnocylindrales bacterium]
MIPDYKLYQGAVLADLVDLAERGISISELLEEGRLHSYLIDQKVGLHVKHSGARLSPWQFTFSPENRSSLEKLSKTVEHVFVVLVCWLDGIVALSSTEWSVLLGADHARQGWIRAERRKRGLYTITGSAGSLSYKKEQGVCSVVSTLGAP